MRRGLYWRGTKTPLGMAAPSPERLIAELVPGPGIGPAGLSAANALRLSTQVPRRVCIAVPDRAPSDTDTVAFVSRAARTGRIESGLNPTEVALLEVLDGWVNLVEVDPIRATQQVVALLRSGTVRVDRLADAATTEPGQARARFRALLNASARPDLAKRVPRADRRTEAAALSGLALA